MGTPPDEDGAPAVHRGRDALRALLRGAADLRALTPADFRRWLLPQVERWREDPAFAQRERLRALRRAHPGLRELERAVRRAVAADEASPRAAALARLERERGQVEKALEGLGGALARAGGAARRAALGAKREGFLARREALARELARAVRESPERQERLRCEAALEGARARAGLPGEEAHLAALLRGQGRRAGGSGASFEVQALAVTRAHLVPELGAGAGAGADEGAGEVRVLRGVTLGAARTELDQLVVRLPPRAGTPVEVLALVEVKRNPDDVAHGFHQRQENLAWLTGDASAYAAADYRTRHFRTGHFDREAVHAEGGARFVLARASFRHFRREGGAGPFLERLHFVTRQGVLHGATGATLSRLRSRVASDVQWAPGSDAYLEGLLGWLQGQLLPEETPGVLRRYCARPALARQVLVVQPRLKARAASPP
jgi:hypothetical protein